MIRHLLKLTWSRKRANALLILEILVSFLVVFAVAAVGLAYLGRLRQPLGFDYRNLYSVTLSARDFGTLDDTPDAGERAQRLLRELETLPEVEAVAAVDSAPFELAYSSEEVEHDGRHLEPGTSTASDGAAAALGLHLVQGRWFEPADDALAWRPVVVNQLLVDELFAGQDPIGATVHADPEWRVVGVVSGFRRGGSLGEVEPYVISRQSLGPSLKTLPRCLLLRVRAGTPAEFEERAVQVVRRLVPELEPQIEHSDQTRRRNLKLVVAPFLVGVVVAASLMTMVVLGMIGLFWQAVTQRTGEIGLRRALGGTRAQVYRQLLTEVLLVTLVGSTLAALVVLQLPLLGLMGGAGWGRVLAALGVSLALMGALATTAGLYPAWLAARVEPAQALHDE